MKFVLFRKIWIFFSIALIALLCTFLSPINKPVLGEVEPEVFVSNYRTGALIPLTSTQEPSVSLNAYGVTSAVKVILYQTNDEALFKDLIHDKDNNQLNKNIDVSTMQQIAEQTVQLNSQSETRVSLPLSSKGIWVLRVILKDKNYDFFLIRSENGVLVKQEDQRYIFWAQNFKSSQSATAGSLKLYSLLNGQKELSSAEFDNQGIAKTPLSLDADIGVAKFGDDEVIFPINLRYLNTSYDYKTFKDIHKTKYFVFTDRPLYKPGDTLYFKAVIRNDYDASYSIPQGIAQVKIMRGYGEPPLTTKDFPISADGTIFGEYKISPDSPTGYYQLRIEIPQSINQDYGSADFQIDYYRKPEYTMELTSKKLELIMGDKSSAGVTANYFFGQPVTDQKIKYQILTNSFYDYEFKTEQPYLQSDEYSYTYDAAGGRIFKGEVILDKAGQAEINFEAKIPKVNSLNQHYDYKKIEGKNQVFSIEALLDDGSGNPAFRRKNVIVYAGEFDIFRTGTNYQTSVGEQINLPIILVPHFKADISRISLKADIHRENWLPYYDADKKYQSYKKEEEDLPAISATTDQDGNAQFSLTPQKPGSYQLTVGGFDKRGNIVKKTFYVYVFSAKDYYNFTGTGGGTFTLGADKKNYLPTDTAKLKIYSSAPEIDVLLSLERGRVHRFQVVHLKGNSANVDIPFQASDIPNLTAQASSFTNNRLESNFVDLPVSAESKKLKINLKTDKERYGPSETVQLDVDTKDVNGNPTSADVAIWAVDKALYELSDSKQGDIFQFFWQKRYGSTASTNSLEGIGVAFGGGGGCFLPDTAILMADGSYKRIDQIKIGDYIKTKAIEADPGLTDAKVWGVHQASVDGYLIINSHLKVTPNHKIYVNKAWMDAGSIQVGDALTDDKGQQIPVTSVEYQKGKTAVYNLQVEKYHTFFADSVFVHNEKGVVRDTFEDTAYWNPSVHTDASGHAQITFTLPDNLTTWKILTTAATLQTQVGQTTADILVQKDVFIRPVLPNILRVGDSAVFSAIVHNFTNLEQSLEVKLESQNLKLGINQTQNITLKPDESKQLYWSVAAIKEADKEQLTFSVNSKKDNKLLDAAVVSLPIRAFGFLEKEVSVGQGSITYPVKLSANADLAKSKISLDLSPTILGPILTSMQYLISYPYGCVEQTTSRLMPALIAKLNPQIFGTALAGKNLDQIIKDGLKRLNNLQDYNGAFSWWQNRNPNYFVTSYVVENLLLAKSSGYILSDTILKNAQRYLEQEGTLSESEQVARIYALSLINLPKEKTQIAVTNLSVTPDILALAVLANIQNGFKDPNSNGFAKLMSLAKTQGDVRFFEAGSKENFGSSEASTALAIRAMIVQGLEIKEITPFVQFLINNRRADYFGNTYATSQTIRALSEFTKLSSETTPDFSYSVSLDEKNIQSGKFTDLQTLNQKLSIPVSDIKNNSNLVITQNGVGQLYSTLISESFNTQRDALAKSAGLSIKRDYFNSKGALGKIAVGDTVEVRLSVSGPAADDFYAVIKDELPAGLVPVNTYFNNEQFYSYSFDDPAASPVPSPTPSVDDFASMETAENGMILSAYKITKGAHVYKYKARAVTEGTYNAPPAQIELMYNPKVSGRSEIDTVTIGAPSAVDNLLFHLQLLLQTYKNMLLAAGAVVLLAIGVLVFMKWRSRKI